LMTARCLRTSCVSRMALTSYHSALQTSRRTC
jgi:hypothetical protein